MNYSQVKDEKKFNYIYLLIVRYENRMTRFCRDMDLPRALVELWLKEQEEAVKTYINEKNAILLKGTQSTEEEIPSVDTLQDEILKKLKTTIAAERDPSKLARALEILKEYSKDTANRKEKEESLYDYLNLEKYRKTEEIDE